MDPEMQLAPQMLGNVIQERRRCVAQEQYDDQRYHERDHPSVTVPVTLALSPPASSRGRLQPRGANSPRGPVGPRLGPTSLAHLPFALLLLALVPGCVPGAPPPPPVWRHVGRARTPLLEIYAESWHLPAPLNALRGMRLVADAPPPAGLAEAVTRAIVRSNPRMPPLDALELATHAIAVAQNQGLDPGFFCSTLLQESGFSPDALSPAGAVGIAQFTMDTADGEGVDPFDW